MNIYDRIQSYELEGRELEVLLESSAEKIAKVKGISSAYEFLSFKSWHGKTIRVILKDYRMDYEDTVSIEFPASVIDNPETLNGYCKGIVSDRERADAERRQRDKELEITRLESRIKTLKEELLK